MKVEKFFKTIIKKIRFKIIYFTLNKLIYNYLYKSYWNYIFSKERRACFENFYYSAEVNEFAGIGHQINNWISGKWFAKKFGLNYAYSPFSSSEWDIFLGFGENEITVNELLKMGFKKVRLPLFDENNLSEVELQKNIINSYFNCKVVFVAEYDQVYKNQIGEVETLNEKFFKSSSRIYNDLSFDKNFLNIAVHIRVGDIFPKYKNRYLNNEYFINVLRKLLGAAKTDKPIAIYLFSQGNINQFVEFKQFDNIHFCLDVNPIVSFLHMVYADILITSKSSFSYKPALLNKGVKVCPKDFWHGYPQSDDWWLVENDGSFAHSNK